MSPTFNFDRYLNIRSAYTPAWLDGGQRVSFLTDITGTPQVWSMETTGGWPNQLTYFQEKVWTLSAAPDGDRLVCTRDIGGNERYQLFLVSSDGAEVRRITQNMNAIYHFGGWSPDGERVAFTSNVRNGVHFDIYVQEVDGGDPEMVYQTEGNFHIYTWSPDGKKLVLCHEISSAQQLLYLLDLEEDEVRPLTLLEEPVNNHKVCWAKNGNVYVLTNQGRDFLGVAKMDIETGQVTHLFEDLTWDVEAMALAPNGRTLAFTSNVDGYSRLCLYNLDTGKLQPVPNLPPGVVSEPVFSPDGSRLAVSAQSPLDNLNIWVVNLEGEPPVSHKLTQSTLAGIPPESLVAPEIIHYETFDGRSIPGFFYRPPVGEASFPCILYVHGGPSSQIIADFDPRFQFFLRCGYAILAPNVRGSSGYGKTYMALDDVELRMDSVTDLKYAVEWLRSSGEVDPDRIAIYGRSYGGFMVLSAITTFPELWAAAIDVVGIANWVTFLENTGPWRQAHREKEYGSLTKDRAFLESISPIHKGNNIQCPLLVVHGANDPRVPVTEADQIVGSLRERNHPVEYLRYEDEGHKIAKLQNRIDSFTKMADFLARYL